MATARMIAKSLSTSERRARLHQEAGDLAEFCQQLYPLLVAHTDDWGRLDGSAFHVKVAVDPTSPRSVEEFTTALLALERVRLIDWYVVDGKQFVQIVDFKRHQPGLNQKTVRCPPFDKLARRVSPGNSGDSTENPSELNLRELKGTQLNKSSGADAPPVRVITKLAHEAIDRLGVSASYVDLREEVKCLCAKHKIAYDADATGKALESALVQRKRSA